MGNKERNTPVTHLAGPSDRQEKPPADNCLRCPISPATTKSQNAVTNPAPPTTTELLKLSVQHYPAVGIHIVVVDGQLDLLTAPLLEQCVHEQLADAPPHLILDLESVRFLGSSGLSCLLRARELAEQTPGSQLHLAGLITHAVARAVQTTGLLDMFSTYPTLIHAVADVMAIKNTSA
jgi:anti-sigma B factor antagonist